MAKREEFRIEEHSRKLYGERHFAVYLVGKRNRDGSRSLYRIGWYMSREDAERVATKAQAA